MHLPGWLVHISEDDCKLQTVHSRNIIKLSIHFSLYLTNGCHQNLENVLIVYLLNTWDVLLLWILLTKTFIVLNSQFEIIYNKIEQTVVGSSPRPNLHQCLQCRHICNYVDQKGLATMLTSVQSAGVTPNVNLRMTQARKHAKRDPRWLWNQGQMSPEVQHRGISGPTKGTCVI